MAVLKRGLFYWLWSLNAPLQVLTWIGDLRTKCEGKRGEISSSHILRGFTWSCQAIPDLVSWCAYIYVLSSRTKKRKISLFSMIEVFKLHFLCMILYVHEYSTIILNFSILSLQLFEVSVWTMCSLLLCLYLCPWPYLYFVVGRFIRRHSVVRRVSAFQPGGPGSIPGGVEF